MAYQQSLGRSPLEKTGRGIAPLMQQVAGTKSFSEKNPNAFKAKELPEMKLSVPNIAANASADSELRANAAFSGNSEKIAQYDRLSKNNSLAIKNDFGAATLYGKGSAKAGDTSAETMTLRQNQGQLPGEKGFKGGTNDRGTTIFPNVQGNPATGGTIPRENQMSGETYAGNTSKTYYKEEGPGALGKLKTLATGQGPKSSSVTTQSFGLIDQFNEAMGGKRNALKTGRDNTGYANTLDEKASPLPPTATNQNPVRPDRANTLIGSGTKSDTEYSKRQMNLTTSGDKNLSFKRAKSFDNPQGQEALRNNDTETLLSLATRGGKQDEEIGYLQANIANKADRTANKGGYESTYKQKYDYPTDVNYNNTKNAQGETELGRNTYSGPKSGTGYFSPESTFAQNKAAATAADANVGLKDFLTKGKSKYFTM